MTPYTLELNDYENEMLLKIQSHGYNDASEVLRAALRLFYKKEFPTSKYIPKNQSAVDPEVQCIIDGGKIIKEKGERICYIKTGALEFRRPLLT